MDSTAVIEKILLAQKIQDVLNIGNLDSEFKQMAHAIHPDVCKHPKAADAFTKLTTFREEFKEGKSYSDDAGAFKSNGQFVEFSGDEALLKESFKNYQILTRLSGADHLFKYLPSRMNFHNGKIRIDFEKRAVPLVGLNLPQKHVNWVLSRMIEFSAMLHEKGGYSHNGINPESIFVVPETHGIVVTSFYHMAKLGGTVQMISGRYKNWYPASLFREKKATQTIDIELAKKTAICLLGDTSGCGVKLKKTHDPHFLDFVISQSQDDSAKIFRDYRAMIDKNYEKKFHILDL